MSNRPFVLSTGHSCQGVDGLHMFLKPPGYQHSLMSWTASRPDTHLEQQHVSFVVCIERQLPKGLNLLVKVLLLLGQGLDVKSAVPGMTCIAG